MAKKKSHYDGYDYPRYWEGRGYEHNCEIFAIKQMIKRLEKPPKNIIDIGCGFGRLLPSYYSSSAKITLLDPSQSLLDIAADKNKSKKIQYKKGDIKDLKKLKKDTYDLALIVRVLHHVEDLSGALDSINSILKSDGYLILEYANKMHGKDQIRNLLHGNFTFPLDISPIDKRSEKNIKENSIPFLNFHPDDIEDKLRALNFKIIEKRSVSNFRSHYIKKIIGESKLLRIEKYLQKPLAKLHFGPSVFILAKKV